MMPSVLSLSFSSPLAKLVVLFFLAHPGSAATFSNTQDFLLSRYPNRDVLPNSIVAREDRAARRPCFQAKPHYTPSPYLFVKVPVPTLAPLDLSAPASANQVGAESSIKGLRPLGAGHASGCPSPSRRRSGVRQVVVGDFISSLEAKADMRGGLSQEETAAYYGVNLPTAAAAAAGGVGMLTVSAPGAALYSSQPQASSKEAHNRVWSMVDGVWRFSSSSVVGAYDNVVGFVESKLNNKAVLKTPSFKFPSIGVGSMRQDLVGFMDLDPFERSRRFHKKRGKFL